jgi:predicted TIM-barrel enzyme
VPPYCGVPRLAHQFPVVVVVAEVVKGDIVGIVVGVVVGVDITVDVGVDLAVDVEVDNDVLQDAKTIDVNIIKVSTPQINPFFKWTSFFS